MDYFVTVREEVLREVASSVIAKERCFQSLGESVLERQRYRKSYKGVRLWVDERHTDFY